MVRIFYKNAKGENKHHDAMHICMIILTKQTQRCEIDNTVQKDHRLISTKMEILAEIRRDYTTLVI